jgi:prepilin-type processing-associated H-X9-DG protein
MEQFVSRRITGLAGISVLLALGSLLPGMQFLGIPALLFGIQALRGMNQVEAGPAPRLLAFFAMALGAVTTIVFVLSLIALVLGNLREKSHRVACQNNLRLLGQAILHYEEDRSVFPSATLPQASLPLEVRMSWLVSILPYMNPPGRAPATNTQSNRALKLFDELDKAKAWNDSANRDQWHQYQGHYLCPSRPESEDPGRRLTSYVGITGIGPNAAEVTIKDHDAGFFGYDRVIAKDNITRGTSNTFMVTETARNNGPWMAAGPPTLRSVDPADQPFIGLDRPFGGMHPGGCNVLFVDGSVRFVQQSVLPDVWIGQARINEF